MMVSGHADRRVEEARLGLVFAVFLLALAAGSMGRAGSLLESLGGAVLAYGAAAALVYVWGERTRPKFTLVWLLVMFAWAIGVVIVLLAHPLQGTAFWMTVLLVLAASLVVRHESGLGPTVLIAIGVFFALFSTGALFADVGGQRLGDDDAVWIAAAAVLSIAAGTLEHERLARRTGPGTPVYWTAFRLVFVAVWTMVILTLREQVQWGRLFLIFGADLTGQGGQILLLGVILAAVATAAFAFRPQKRKEGRDGSPR